MGDSASLVCGTHLHSNPLANITWRDPNGVNISYRDRHSDHLTEYTLENGPDVVRLNISDASESDNGLWRCTVSVRDTEVYSATDESLMLERGPDSEIGMITVDIQLNVVCKYNQQHFHNVK